MLNVLTWPVHGSYMQSLAGVPVRWIVPTGRERLGYGGRGTTFDLPDNVVEVPASELSEVDLDVVAYQHRTHWEEDRHELLTARQRDVPALYIEHDPPREHPTDTVHPVDDGRTLVVHVTAFNALMWDTRSPWTVVDHGVAVPPRAGSLALPVGITIINDLDVRGRRLGLDVFRAVRERVPVELIGAGADRLGGRGEVLPADVPGVAASHRFLFSPIRYTSLGLGILEAMAAGLPVVGLATTELVTVVRNGENGFVHTDVDAVVEDARRLVADHALALELGARARSTVRQRFGLGRFVSDWTQVLRRVADRGSPVWDRAATGSPTAWNSSSG